MTKDEFINGYLTRSGYLHLRTPNGYKVGDWECIALPCECDDELCEGWQMVSKEMFEKDVARGNAWLYHLPAGYIHKP